ENGICMHQIFAGGRMPPRGCVPRRKSAGRGPWKGQSRRSRVQRSGKERQAVLESLQSPAGLRFRQLRHTDEEMPRVHALLADDADAKVADAHTLHQATIE
ncbi:unnamed protein product, partial [Nesidiocoris tenuis]